MTKYFSSRSAPPGDTKTASLFQKSLEITRIGKSKVGPVSEQSTARAFRVIILNLGIIWM
jgi:hypothetical protein